MVLSFDFKGLEDKFTHASLPKGSLRPNHQQLLLTDERSFCGMASTVVSFPRMLRKTFCPHLSQGQMCAERAKDANQRGANLQRREPNTSISELYAQCFNRASSTQVIAPSRANRYSGESLIQAFPSSTLNASIVHPAP